MLATDGVEQIEPTEPVKALKAAGAEVKVVSDKDEIQSFKHHDKGSKIPVDESLDDADADVRVDAADAVTNVTIKNGLRLVQENGIWQILPITQLSGDETDSTA